MELICPKCQGAMRTYERSGITVDQCSECRGIFLDRGELERLVDAETAFHATSGSAPSVAAPAYGSPGGERHRDERPREDRYRDERHRDERYRDDRDKDARYRDDRYKDDKYKDDRHKDDRYRSSGGHDEYKEGHYDPRKQKKRSFLDDLFG